MHTSSIHLFSVVYAQCHLKKPTKNHFFQPSHSCLSHHLLQFCNYLVFRLQYLASISIISARTGFPILPKLPLVPPLITQQSCAISSLTAHSRMLLLLLLAPPHHCFCHSLPIRFFVTSVIEKNKKKESKGIRSGKMRWQYHALKGFFEKTMCV